MPYWLYMTLVIVLYPFGLIKECIADYRMKRYLARRPKREPPVTRDAQGRVEHPYGKIK